jgi:hypothetical protein
VDLTDERIDVDRQRVLARPGAGRPRPRKAVGEHPIQLADVPERERPQERPKRRRRRDPMPEHRGGLPRAQHVAVLDAVSAQDHRADHRHHLATRIRAALALAEIHARVDQLLDPQPARQQRGHHHAGVGDRPLIVEHHDRRFVHHQGDLLSGAATAAICRYQALLGRSLHPITRMERWIEA